jgi:ATP-dependent DNA helicase RecG
MLAAVEAGYQAVLMAPTEILARQHLHAIDALLWMQQTPVIFLAGSLTTKQREAAREQLRTTPAAMVIGTHALFQEGVAFANLALIVIDEQHRFGVTQRLALSDKGLAVEGKAPHVLLMTATPIPRSLAMACYGDLDVSLLKQKPANRLPIETLAIGLGKLEAFMAGIARALASGEKIYWICPLVEEMGPNVSNPLLASLQAAEKRYQALALLFLGKVGMVHGRMSMAEREPVMQAFVRGDIQILVATTVVEVGVDVPDATVMVIENAERFGLAQLHQLRGRVGRGAKPSRCILLYQERCSVAAKERLKIMRQTNDGFIIAEADLKLRGSGELLGTKQTGVPEYRFISLEKDADLLAAAKQEATLALEQDATLSSARGEALRQLLGLFSLEDAVRYLRSG